MKAVVTIYQILNKANGKVYIGSTARDLKIRFKEHVAALKSGRHGSPHLQRAWNEWGSENFGVIALDTCNISERKEIEQSYIDKFKASDPNSGYNTNDRVDSRYGRPMTPESRLKMSLAHTPVSEETRKRLLSYRLGVKHSAETKRKLSLVRSGSGNGFYGKRHSEETRLKMSASAKNRPSNRKGCKCSSASRKRMSKAQKLWRRS